MYRDPTKNKKLYAVDVSVCDTCPAFVMESPYHRARCKLEDDVVIENAMHLRPDNCPLPDLKEEDKARITRHIILNDPRRFLC